MVWQDAGLVFATAAGTAMDAANVRRDFRRIASAAGLVGRKWTPQELRHGFVSLLSGDGMSVERIAVLVGHSGASVAGRVCRRRCRRARSASRAAATQ
ncbi:MAG TPA: tyrosine-type recombinase/integrase [Pseudonocardiaceae bacterium]